MDLATLMGLLERGEPVVVLDIRPAESRAEWGIPGSLWVDAYHAVGRGDYRPLEEVEVPAGRPVVVVCEMGQTSQLAARFLRSRGLDAHSLDGGMRAWSLAWNVAEEDLPDGTRVVQVRRTGKGCLSYVVISRGEAVVVDPAVPPDVYQGVATGRGARIVGVLDTHVHADHLTRARLLAAELRVPYYLPRTAGARVGAPFEPLDEGGRVPFGATGLEVVPTPGHTWESCTYYLPDGVALTGDTLFLEGVGRPDLEAAPEEGPRRAAALYRSLRRLQGLPGSTRVYPGHASAPLPFDGIPWSATVAEVWARLPLLRLDEGDFVRVLMSRVPPTPPNHHRIVALNEEGAWPDAPEALEAGANRCAVR